jgi:hypothetical protein
MEQNRSIIRMDERRFRLAVEGLTPFLEFCGDDDRFDPCYDAMLAVAEVEP